MARLVNNSHDLGCWPRVVKITQINDQISVKNPKAVDAIATPIIAVK